MEFSVLDRAIYYCFFPLRLSWHIGIFRWILYMFTTYIEKICCRQKGNRCPRHRTTLFSFNPSLGLGCLHRCSSVMLRIPNPPQAWVSALTPAISLDSAKSCLWTGPSAGIDGSPGLAVGAGCPSEGVGARSNMMFWYLMDLFIYIDPVKLFGSIWALAWCKDGVFWCRLKQKAGKRSQVWGFFFPLLLRK